MDESLLFKEYLCNKVIGIPNVKSPSFKIGKHREKLTFGEIIAANGTISPFLIL